MSYLRSNKLGLSLALAATVLATSVPSGPALAGTMHSVTVAGKSYSFDDQADFLYSTADGTKTYADHQTFFGHDSDDAQNYAGAVLHVATSGSIKPEWYRVTKSACRGGPILAESSPDNRNWGVQRYKNEKTYQNKYIQLFPNTDSHRTGYAVVYYLCLRKTGQSFAVAPQ